MGISFLAPVDATFALAALVPLAALLATERRSGRIRRALALAPSRPLAALPVAVALLGLVSLVAVAAAQPVVVRQRLVNERADAQAYFVFDTSLSMAASSGPRLPNRLARAKQLALRLRAALPDVPIGIASMTDRTLPNLLPTTDGPLFRRTLSESVAIDSPPPSQVYPKRATSFDALIPLAQSNFYGKRVDRRLLVVFTDGEADKVPALLNASLQGSVTPIFVHVWRDGERIYSPDGRVDPKYVADPASTGMLDLIASAAGGPAYTEQQGGAVASAARAAVGYGGATRTRVAAYARISLAPWFVLGAVVPLGFLLWRRNF